MNCIINKIIATFSVTLMLTVQSLYSQDVHFSQFDAAPLYYNPALTGLYECDKRIITNFKGQWSTYNSYMLSYDQPIQDFTLFGGTLGVGGLVNADYAGENTYGNTMIKLLPSYHYPIIAGKLKLSTGLDIMLNKNSIDKSTVVLPGGINPNTGDGTVGSDLENTSLMYADLGLGFNFQYMITDKMPINLGVTFNRLLGSGGGGLATNATQPNYKRYSLNANTVYQLNSNVSLLPSFIFSNQKKYNEMNAGTFAKFSTGQYTPLVDALYAGAWYRVGDAIILGIAFDKPLTKKWVMNFGLSYDVTVSSFSDSDKWKKSSNVGSDSFEFSIKFINCKVPIIIDPDGIINDPFR